MKNFKPFIHVESRQYSEKFSGELLRKFKTTVRSSSAAPTLWTRCRLGEFELMERMGIQLTQILHADQEYEFLQFAEAETPYVYSTRLNSVVEKKSKGMILHFLGFETRVFREKDSMPVAVARSGILFREPETTA